MGIGTSAFNERFAVQRAALEKEMQLAGCVDDTYVHEMLGVAFRLPPFWIVRDLQEIAKTSEGRLLSRDDDEANDVFRSLTDEFLPLITVGAPTLDDPVARLGPHELSPVAVLQVECHVPGGASAPFDLAEHVATDLANMAEFIEDFEVVTEPRAAELSRAEAITYSAGYTVLHADAVEGCPARERAYYVRQHEYVLALRLCDYPDRDPRLAFDFDNFLRTVTLR